MFSRLAISVGDGPTVDDPTVEERVAKNSPRKIVPSISSVPAPAASRYWPQSALPYRA
jgi:hypothetical protein